MIINEIVHRFWGSVCKKIYLVPIWYQKLKSKCYVRLQIRLCYDTCNATFNQRVTQSTPAIFSFKSWTMDVVITVEKVRARNAGRRLGAPHMYWPHIWWLNQAVTRVVDCNERWLYAALIIHCVDCSVAESQIRRILASFSRRQKTVYYLTRTESVLVRTRF
jgi:hypothetical protein